jgi:hypothetical protein
MWWQGDAGVDLPRIGYLHLGFNESQSESGDKSNNKGIEREKLPLRKRWLLEETKNNNFAPLSLGSKALLSFCSLCLRLKSRVDANKAKQVSKAIEAK